MRFLFPTASLIGVTFIMPCSVIFGQNELPFYGASTSSQSIPSSADSTSSDNARDYRQEQIALGQEMRQLVAQGATTQQLQAWEQQNSSRFVAQQQRAISMGQDSILLAVPSVPSVRTPATLPSSLNSYLAIQTALANARVQIHDQLVQALSGQISDAQITRMQQSESQLFQQLHDADSKAQLAQAQALSAVSNGQPLPVPPPLQLPPNTSAQLRSYLTLLDQVMRQQIAIWNANISASLSTRQAAVQLWQQQNAANLVQLQKLAQALSSTPN